MKRVNILGVEISAVTMDSAIQSLCDDLDAARGRYICACNVHTTVMAHDDEEFRRIENGSFMTLPDGGPLAKVGAKRGYSEMGHVTGPEFMENVMKRSQQTGWSHYFYGNTAENLEKMVENIKKDYPWLKIAGSEPSVFRPLEEREEIELVGRINDSGADFVWVGLGAPRQEKLCAKLADKTRACFVGVGGAFSILAGAIPRAPRWMQDHSLEWLYRLLKEPRRLFKRYFVTNSKFLFLLAFKDRGKKGAPPDAKNE